MIHKFKGLPGERSVSKGHYHFMDERRGWAVVDKDQWTQNIFPGSRLSMSIILAELHASSAQCPRNKTHRVLMPETPASEPSNWLYILLEFLVIITNSFLVSIAVWSSGRLIWTWLVS